MTRLRSPAESRRSPWQSCPQMHYFAGQPFLTSLSSSSFPGVFSCCVLIFYACQGIGEASANCIGELWRKEGLNTPPASPWNLLSPIRPSPRAFLLKPCVSFFVFSLCTTTFALVPVAQKKCSHCLAQTPLSAASCSWDLPGSSPSKPSQEGSKFDQRLLMLKGNRRASCDRKEFRQHFSFFLLFWGTLRHDLCRGKPPSGGGRNAYADASRKATVFASPHSYTHVFGITSEPLLP